jgi:hypothetical protein
MKKSEISKHHSKIIHDILYNELMTYDLPKWKQSCRGFGPIHYVSNTRKMWLEKNQYRLEGAREIVEFVDRWVTHFRDNGRFDKYTIALLKQEVIRVVRRAMQSIEDEIGILNAVKLSGFKTLIKWADNPSELNKGPYKGRKTLPKKSK